MPYFGSVLFIIFLLCTLNTFFEAASYGFDRRAELVASCKFYAEVIDSKSPDDTILTCIEHCANPFDVTQDTRLDGASFSKEQFLNEIFECMDHRILGGSILGGSSTGQTVHENPLSNLGGCPEGPPCDKPTNNEPLETPKKEVR